MNDPAQTAGVETGTYVAEIPIARKNTSKLQFNLALSHSFHRKSLLLGFSYTDLTLRNLTVTPANSKLSTQSQEDCPIASGAFLWFSGFAMACPTFFGNPILSFEALKRGHTAGQPKALDKFEKGLGRQIYDHCKAKKGFLIFDEFVKIDKKSKKMEFRYALCKNIKFTKKQGVRVKSFPIKKLNFDFQ